MPAAPPSPSSARPRALAGVALGIAAACALLVAARPAEAFCRTRTVPVAPDFQPTPTACWTQGVPVYQPSQCVTYHVGLPASRQATYGDLSEIFARSFARWSAPNGACTPGISAVELAPIEGAVVEYQPNGPNANVIVVRDDAWPHADANNTLALTTLSFKPETGEILDADMELNTHDQRLSVGDPVPIDGYDLETIVQHETGHFLGLAHTGDAKALMYANYTPGATHRKLEPDDVAGICEIYPSRSSRSAAAGLVPATACDLAASTGAPCGTPNITHGCAAAPHARSPWGVAAATLALAAALARARRQRRAA